MNNSVTFDLTPQAVLCKGILCFSSGFVVAEIEGTEVFRRSVSDICELKQYTDFGCGRLEMRLTGEDKKALDESENIFICRFTMTAVNEIAEFCKMVNHYIKSGEQTEINLIDSRKCPKCGRNLPAESDICMFCIDKAYIARRTFSMFKKYLPSVIVAGLLLTLSNAAFALAPLLNGRLIDNYLSPAEGFNASIPASKGIPLLCILMIIAAIAAQVMNVFHLRISNKIGSKISNDMRLEVYDKVQRLSLTSISKKTAGDLIKRITNDTAVVRDFITDQGQFAISQILLFVIIAVILLLKSPLMTFLIFVPVPLSLFFISRFWHFIHLRYEKQWVHGSRTQSILHDIIKGIRVVKSFGNEKREIEKFSAANKRYAEIAAKNERTWALVFPSLNYFVGIGEFFVLLIGGRMVLQGKMTMGDLYTFTMFITYILNPLRWMASLPRWLAELVTSLLKIFEVIDETQTVKDAPEPVELDYTGDLEFRDVRFGYKSYEPVLRDIELKIKQGEMIGLVGHSGAGKSTMINLVMRLYDPNAGALTIGGTDIRLASQGALREHIGVVFQETVLFAGSIYDNIAYAKSGASPLEVIDAAKTANAHEFIMKLPDGYNTVVGENGHTLSGGERQRIAIARAVLKDPKILILDEATSALDSETEAKIQEALARLIKNRTTIAIAHRLATLRNADRLVVLEKGEIAEVGSHSELLRQNGIYYKLVMAQRQTSKLKKDDQDALEAAE